MEASNLNFQGIQTSLYNSNSDIHVYYRDEYYQNKLVRKRIRAQIQKRRRVQAIRRFIFFTVLFCTCVCFLGVNTVAKNIFKNDLQNIHLQFTDDQLLASSHLLGEKIAYSYETSFQSTENILTPMTLYQEDTNLTNKIKNLVNNYTHLKCHLFIYNTRTGQHVDINGRSPVPAASIIKIPVMFAMFREHLYDNDLNTMKFYYREYHKALGSGKLQYSMSDRKIPILDITKVMIRDSDNTATNIVLDEVGGMDNLNKQVKQWGLSKTEMHNWLPDLEGTNITTPYDIANILYNLNNTNFISIEARHHIETMMSNISNRNLINHNLPTGSVLLNKTGDIGTMLGDAGLVRLPNGSEVIIVAMIERPWNAYSAKELIQKISETTTHYYNF